MKMIVWITRATNTVDGTQSTSFFQTLKENYTDMINVLQK